MVQISVVYQGDLRTQAVHGPSGTAMVTDAPKDNHGKGESFSPTDLMATALASCILTTMVIATRIDLTGSTASVTKEMVATPRRRIGRLKTVVEVKTAVDDVQKQALMQAAMTCPVKESLGADVDVPIEFRWSI